MRPHGVHGEIKIKPLTDDVSRFKKLREAFVEMQENSFTPVAVTSSKILSGNGVAVKIDGYNTVEQAESLHGKYLCVDRAHAVKLPEGTYFVSDLISCRVVSSDGDELGFIEDIYETNANDVYVVRGKQKLSVPALKKLLDRVDVENKLIVFNAQVLSEVGLFED